MAKKGFTIHIDEQVIDDFRRYCNINALKVSAKVEMILKREIDHAKVNPTLVEMFQRILEGQKIIKAQNSDEQMKVDRNISQGISEAEILKMNRTDVKTEISSKIDEERQLKADSEPKSENKKEVPTIDYLKRVKGI